jgi:hypothetical protein
MASYIKNLPTHIKWILLFGLWALHGAIAFWQFQSEIGSKGTSLAYLTVRVFLLAWIAISFALIFLAHRGPPAWVKFQEALATPKAKDVLLIAASSLFFVRVCLWIVYGLLAQPLTQQIGGYLRLLSPVLDLIGYVSFEVALLVFVFNLPAKIENNKSFQRFVSSALFVFVIFAVLSFIISVTKLGILSTYRGDWQRGIPAVALLEWQILLACGFGLVVFLLEAKTRLTEIPRLDLWVCMAIWLGASSLWLSQPVIPNPLALEPTGPNYEIYPFNDAQTYDGFAQSVLAGSGFGYDQIPQRPLYVVFLVLSHMLVGQDYNRVIFIQTLALAFFPVLLYLLGKELFGRPVGISVALLAILRDYVSNFVSPFTGNISYSKLYLSELPTAIFLLIFLLVGIRWVKMGFPLFSGFLLGGILGAAMLIRTQVVVAMPVLLLCAVLVNPKGIKSLIKSALLAIITIILMAAPWLWRNWQLTGELVFDNPNSQNANLALRYSMLNGTTPEILPLSGEGTAEYSARLNQIAMDAIKSNPMGALWGVINSFVNHGVNNVLLFPLRDDFHSFRELWIPSYAFWEKWEGTPTLTQSVLLAIYLSLLGLGISAAWIRNRWVGLLPLALNLAYNLWTSLALLSGQRFMVAMDWSIYMYYMIGLFVVAGSFLYALNGVRDVVANWVGKNQYVANISAPSVRWSKYIWFSVLFLVIGFSLPLSGKVFSPRNPLFASQRELTEKFSASLNIPSGCLQKLLDTGELSVIQGRAIYPRYYAAGEGETFTDSVGYKAVTEGRLVFDLVGQSSGRYIFKISQEPTFFPHASDVVLMSSSKGGPWFVLVKQRDVEKFYVSDSWKPSTCVLPESNH